MNWRSPIRRSSIPSPAESLSDPLSDQVKVEKIMEAAVRNSAPGWASQSRGSAIAHQPSTNIILNPSTLPPWARYCLGSAPRPPRLKTNKKNISGAISQWRKLSTPQNTEDPIVPASNPVAIDAERLWLLGYLSGSFSKSTTISWKQVTEAFNHQFSKNLAWDELAVLMAPPAAEGSPIYLEPGPSGMGSSLRASLHAAGQGHEEMTVREEVSHNQRLGPLTLAEVTWLIAYITSHNLFIGQTPASFWERAAAAYQREFGLVGFRDTLPKMISRKQFFSQLKEHGDYEDGLLDQDNPSPEDTLESKHMRRSLDAYTPAQINWLLAHGQLPEKANWNKITSDFNHHFNSKRHPHPLYVKWWSLITPPKRKRNHDGNEETTFTMEQTEWLLNMVPVLTEPSGITNWGEVAKEFKAKFRLVKPIGSLYSQWRYITLYMQDLEP